MIEQAVHDILTADSAITAIVAKRVRPVLGASKDQYHITYDVKGREVGADSGVKTFRGPSAWSKTSVEIGAYAATYSDCVALASEIRRVLDGVGVSTATTKIAPSVLEDESDVEQVAQDGQNKPAAFVRFQTYRMLHKEL